MKKATRIVIIVEMVLLCWMIAPIVFGIIALKKLETATRRADISTAFGVSTLIFGPTIGGLLLLIMKDSDYEEQKPAEPAETV
jgi:hypothetical protein